MTEILNEVQLENIISQINSSNGFDELKQLDILPNPDCDDGYYFVSYSHKDYKKVLIDIIKYRQKGIKIWYDRGLEAGKSWIEDVCRKIDDYKCKGFIYYNSKNYENSVACQKEYKQAIDSKQDCLLIDIVDSDLDSYEMPFEDKISAIRDLRPRECYEFIYSNYVKGALVNRVNDKNIESAIIPEYCILNGKRKKVKGISFMAFANCVKLKEVWLPNDLIVIANDAFFNCFSLKRVIFNNSGKKYFTRFCTVREAFTNCINIKSLDQLEFIGSKKSIIYLDKAFKQCNDIVSASEKYPFIFGKGVFIGSISLETVDMKRNKNVEDYAFAFCTKLKIVENQGVTKIGKKAYRDCNSLIEFKCNDELRIIDDYAFLNCKNLKTVEFNSNLRYIKNYSFANCESLEEIVIGRKCRFFTTYSFVNCFNLKRIVITSSKTLIVDGRFAHFLAPIVKLFPMVKEFVLPSKVHYNIDGLKKVGTTPEGLIIYEVEND